MLRFIASISLKFTANVSPGGLSFVASVYLNWEGKLNFHGSNSVFVLEDWFVPSVYLCHEGGELCSNSVFILGTNYMYLCRAIACFERNLHTQISS